MKWCAPVLAALCLSLTLFAQNPIPFVNAPLSPSNIAPGSADFTLTTNGANFVSGSTVYWNGVALSTSYVNQNRLTATVLAADVAAASTAQVTVVSPAPGGGTSNIVPFTVTSAPSGLTFSSATYSVGSSVVGVVTGDFNRDGKIDLAVANESATDQSCFPGSSTGSVSVLSGNGDGTFTSKWTYDLDCISGPSGRFSAFDVSVGDFNNDGIADLAVTFRSSGLYSVATFLGAGDGTFTYAGSQPLAGAGFDALNQLALADFNRDGNLDFAFGFNATGYVSLAAALGSGSGTSSLTFYPSYLGAGALVTGDFNGDGILDLATGPGYTFASDTPILMGAGDGTFTAAATQPGISMDSPVATGDFNGDGILDLAFSDESTNAVDVLLGNGDGTFTLKGTTATGQAFFVMNAADVNGDGKLDLVIDNQPGMKVSVLLGNGDGTFQAQQDFAVATVPITVTVADFNNDGRLDMVSANGDATVTVLMNTTPRPAPTTTTVASSADPVAPNSPVTYTATIIGQSGVATTGSVTFKDGTRLAAVVPVSGNQATFHTSYATQGVHGMTATYSGDANNTGSVSNVLTEYVRLLPVPTQTTIVTSGSPSLINQNVTFTSHTTSMAGSIPDGELVTFYDGMTAIGSGSTAGGTASFSTGALGAGTHSIKATYSGDASFKSSTGSVQQVVTLYPTTTSLSSSPNPSTYGQAVGLVAAVSSPVSGGATGTVTFKNGTTVLGTTILNGGTALLATTKLPVGSWQLTATYNGDAQSGKSPSAAVTQVVTAAASSTSVIPSKNPAYQGDSIRFTVTVTSADVAPTGAVTLYDHKTVLGTLNLSGGIANFTTSRLGTGGHQITATYAGTGNISSSSSATFTEHVHNTPKH